MEKSEQNVVVDSSSSLPPWLEIAKWSKIKLFTLVTSTINETMSRPHRLEDGEDDDNGETEAHDGADVAKN